jgi:hypothetical protein
LSTVRAGSHTSSLLSFAFAEDVLLLAEELAALGAVHAAEQERFLRPFGRPGLLG